jgi:hypothetical protein
LKEGNLMTPFPPLEFPPDFSHEAEVGLNKGEFMRDETLISGCRFLTGGNRTFCISRGFDE